MTLRAAVVPTLWLQEASVARAAKVWVPEVAPELAQVYEKVPAVALNVAAVQAPPSICTSADWIPEASEAVPVIGVSAQVIVAPAAGAVRATAGAVVSLQPRCRCR